MSENRSETVPMDRVAGHTVVVCDAGPLNGQGFWASDLAARQRSAKRVQGPHTPPDVLRVLGYRPTRRTRKIKTSQGQMEALVCEFRSVTEVIAS